MLRRNDAGRWTKPSPAQYPHQWNWDSCFAALGWATFDWDRAVLELESLLEARWRDGMVPHLRYDPVHLADYFPGPDWWPKAQAQVATAGIPTSGISNPPVLPLALLRVGRRQADAARRHAFWARNLEPAAAWLRWFLERRRPPGLPLPVLVHPWETGWDNSPRWDALQTAGLKPSRPFRRLDTRHVAASQRPSDRDYGAYLRLAELLEEADYDVERYLRSSPFAVHDAVVDALWHAGARALNEVAEELGREPLFGEDALAEYAAAFRRVHWDGIEGTYRDVDVLTGRRLEAESAAGVAALAGGLASREEAERVWKRYRRLAGGCHLVPTVPPTAPQFDPGRYWRGPVWISVNWLSALGLRSAGLAPEAAELARGTLGLLAEAGFQEYFEPLSGEGLGIASFTWSAALALDLLEEL